MKTDRRAALSCSEVSDQAPGRQTGNFFSEAAGLNLPRVLARHIQLFDSKFYQIKYEAFLGHIKKFTQSSNSI